MNGYELALKLVADNTDLAAKLRKSQQDLDKLSKSGQAASNSMSGSFKNILAAGKAYLSVQAAKILLNFTGEIDTVSKAFQNLAANAEGGASGLLAAMKKASRGTISELEIMKASNIALQLMGDDVASMLPKMAEIATKTARAQGVSASQMLNDIVTASGRQSVMILDNLGISSVQAGIYMEEYARTLGKTRLQLTDTERRAAFFYATMKAGGEIAAKSGDDTLSWGEQIQKIGAILSNFATWAGNKIIPALSAIGSGFASIAESIEKLNRESQKGNQQIERFSTKGKPGYIERSKFKYDTEWQYKEVGADGNVTRMWTEADKAAKRTGKSGTTSSAGNQKPPETSLSDFYAYTGKLREAEIVKEQEAQAKIQMSVNLSNEQKIAANDAYRKRIQDIDNKYNQSHQVMTKGMESAFTFTMSAIDNVNKQVIYNMMWGKGGWKSLQKSVGDIFKQLLADITYMMLKAIALQAILGATGGIGGAGGGFISKALSRILEKGYVPSFEKGRIPMLANGIPSDHFMAYIGTKEAVINKQSTLANLSLLKWMNDNPGQSYGGDVVVHNNLTLDGQTVFENQEKYRRKMDSLSGTKSRFRESVY